MTDLLDDQQNREHALLPASYIVEAPAGAGKTELLTQRFLMLLARVDHPEAVVAMTFTNKAAAEMRARILRSLVWAQQATDPATLAPHQVKTLNLAKAALAHARAHDWQILESPARLRVLTMDSFVGHLVRQMPIASHGAPRVSEQPENLYQQAAEQTIALLEEPDYGAVITSTLGYFRNETPRCIGLLNSMLAKRDQWLLHTTSLLTQQHISATLAQVLESELSVVLRHFQTDSTLASLLDWQPTSAQMADLPHWQALADLLLTSAGTARKRLGDKAVLEKLTPEICAALHRVRALPTDLSDEEVVWVETFSQFLQLAVAQLALVFQQCGEVDFVEMTLRALQALGTAETPSEVALRLDYQISHLLVDEFQDTSQSQLTLLRALVRGWQADDGRTLFVVGDPMQSIYRFRKAEVSLFAQVQAQGVGEVRLQTLRLSLNNRASAKLVAWINQNFSLAFADSPLAYQPFHANKPDNESVDVHLYPLLGEFGSEQAFLAEQEAQEALAQIKLELAQGGQDIAVLVRARRHILPLVRLLRRDGVRFQALNVEALSERQAVQDLLSLAHAVHHQADRLYGLAILRAPWCGLTLSDLHALAGQDRQRTLWALMQDETLVASLSADGQQRLGFVREVLAQAWREQGRQRRSIWLRNTWLRLRGVSTLWSASDVVDIEALLGCVDALEASGQFSLPALAEEASKLYAAADTHPESARLKLMTVHGAKGLEFDCVFLLGMGNFGAVGTLDQPLLRWESLPTQPPGVLAAPYLPRRFRQESAPNLYDYLSQRERARESDEAIRVLYVACTRAKRALHLFATARLNASGEKVLSARGSALKMLWPAFEQAFAEAEVLSSPPVADEQPFTAKLRRLTSDALTPLDLPLDLPTPSLYVSPELSNQAYAAEPNSLAADIGTLCHRYLELMMQKGATAWSSERLQACLPNIQHWLTQHGHAPTEAQNVLALLTRTLQSTDGQWLLRARADDASELAFSLREGAKVSHYRLDRTFVEAGERWIIDYKTNTPPSTEPLPLHAWAVEKFSPQLDKYAQCFADEDKPLRRAVFLLALAQLLEI